MQRHCIMLFHINSLRGDSVEQRKDRFRMPSRSNPPPAKQNYVLLSVRFPTQCEINSTGVVHSVDT
jgi:hypothetical protein